MKKPWNPTKRDVVTVMATAVDASHGRPDATMRAIEFQRRYVMLCRRHGIGNHPLTGEPPTQSPVLDWTLGWFDIHKPEFVREREALMAEFADARDSEMWLRHVTFSEAELAAEIGLP